MNGSNASSFFFFPPPPSIPSASVKAKGKANQMATNCLAFPEKMVGQVGVGEGVILVRGRWGNTWEASEGGISFLYHIYIYIYRSIDRYVCAYVY